MSKLPARSPPTPARAFPSATANRRACSCHSVSRSPDPTEIDPNDPKGKQKAIHPVETFAEYSARKAREAKEKA